ncbi:MAG: hypothetical protein AAF581_03415 [Planctomycetota bacterium]
MKTDKLRNKVKKVSTVTTNDPKNNRYQLSMGGMIQAILNTSPAQARLKGLVSEEKTETIRVSKGSDLMIEILEVKPQYKRVEVKAVREIVAGKRYEIDVLAKPGTQPRIESDVLKVKLRTSDGEERTSDLRVIVEHQSRVTVTPRNNLFFRKQQTQALKSGQKSHITQSLFLAGAKPGITFNVTGVEIKGAEPGLFEADFTEVKEDTRFRVSVKLKRFIEEPIVRGTLVVYTDDPETPKLDVRLVAQFIDQPRRNTGTRAQGRPGAAGRSTPRRIPPPKVVPPKVVPPKKTQ